MKSIQNFFTAIDIFGVSYGFRYKDREKYQTALGGFIIILFLILVIVVGIYYFIPFINRKNYTIVYYTMNLAATEEVSLFESNSNFAVGLTCEANSEEKMEINQLLDLKSRYVNYIKSRDGTYKKDAKNLETHKCTYEDFYNKFDKQMDYLNVQKFECVADKDSIQGIYADQVFSYYEFSVLAKNKSHELLSEIERFLFQNDCKLQFVYTDIIIDLDNYKEPLTQYLNEIFIQLNPVLFIKRNIYFMNQDFTNDNYLMFVFGDDEAAEVKPLYSRYEEYALYKGLGRSATQPEEYDYFTKIYIRADLKKTIIKRKYQKFMEFYADSSSLLLAVYEVLVIIFNYVDAFYANHSLANLIFFFKELENESGFNVCRKKSKIQELLYMTDIQSKNNSIEFDSKGSNVNNNKYFPPSNKDSERMNVLDKENNKEDNQKDIKIYNRKKNAENKQGKNPSYLKANEIEDKKEMEKLKTNNKLMKTQKNSLNDNTNSNSNRLVNYLNNKDNILGNDENNSRKMSQIRSSKNGDAIMNFKYKPRDPEEYSESMGTNMEDPSSESGSDGRGIKVVNSFNIFEIIITEFFCCCMSRSMTIKKKANEKANNILFKKMDIITYVRNMILFDITNQINLDNNKRTIINFLGRPVISLKGNQKNEFDEFYRNYKEKDFKKFSYEIQEITQKPSKNHRDDRLISISNEHLKAFV